MIAINAEKKIYMRRISSTKADVIETKNKLAVTIKLVAKKNIALNFDALICIMTWLKPSDIIMLSRTCRSFYCFATCDYVWRRIYGPFTKTRNATHAKIRHVQGIALWILNYYPEISKRSRNAIRNYKIVDDLDITCKNMFCIYGKMIKDIKILDFSVKHIQRRFLRDGKICGWRNDEGCRRFSFFV